MGSLSDNLEEMFGFNVLLVAAALRRESIRREIDRLIWKHEHRALLSPDDAAREKRRLCQQRRWNEDHGLPTYYLPQRVRKLKAK